MDHHIEDVHFEKFVLDRNKPQATMRDLFALFVTAGMVITVCAVLIFLVSFIPGVDPSDWIRMLVQW